MTYAPILLFVYNRPEHTHRLITSLLANREAAESPLIIYADQARNETDRLHVEEVRTYLRSLKGFGNITLVERTENWGLARNIIDGVTTQLARYGRVIVLEDDLVVSPYFLQFMNEALETYKDEERVGHIQACDFTQDHSSSNGPVAGDGPPGNMPGNISTRTARNCWKNWNVGN